MQNTYNKVVISLIIVSISCAFAIADNRKTFLSHGPSVSSFGKGETAVSNMDNISSSFYNPSLLAQLSERNLVLSHFSLYEGSVYNYAGFGLPIKNNIYAAFHLLNLRSGDIEIRQSIIDDPVITQTNHWAYLFSFAKKICKPYDLDIGLNVKYIYTDLYNYSAGGTGIDLGIYKSVKGPYILKNKSDLKLGFSIQNVINPRIKLISEEDVYPTIYTLGCSLKFPTLYRVFSYDEIIIATDMSFEENILSTKLGLEYIFSKQYILRLGLYEKHITIGTGYKNSDFSIDYAYDLSDYYDINRISVSYLWKNTNLKKTLEKDKFSLGREAQDSLKRAKEEKKKKDKIVKKLLKNAINKYNNKNYLKATKLFKEIILKYPEYEMADNYNKKILFEMKQTKTFEMLKFEKLSYAKAYIDYHDQNYHSAINEWKKVLEVNPKRKEVSEYVAKVKAYLLDNEQQNKEKELKNKMLTFFNAGIAFFENNKWLLSIKNMEKVQKICKNNIFPESIEYYKKSKNYIQKSVSELSEIIQTDSESSIRENTEVIDAEGAEKHYNEGLVLYASGKTFKAIKSWEIALRLNPDHNKAKKALEKVKELK